MNYKKGFTLIELLVVVAIIGVLASVVLASLNSARSKGNDSAIKSNLANIRSQAELIFSASGCYGDATPITDTTCAAFAASAVAQCLNTTADTLFANPTVWSMISSAASAAGGIANTACYLPTGGTTWGVAVTLRTSDGNAAPQPDAWCVDSTGASKPVTWGAGQGILQSLGADATPCP